MFFCAYSAHLLSLNKRTKLDFIDFYITK